MSHLWLWRLRGLVYGWLRLAWWCTVAGSRGWSGLMGGGHASLRWRARMAWAMYRARYWIDWRS